MKKALLIGVPVVVVTIIAGVLLWWFVLRDDAPEEASLPDRPEIGTTAPTSAGSAAAPAQPATPDGTWSVQPGELVFAGYRVDELFAGETIQKTAVGRSPAVAGSIAITAGQLTAASFQVDMTQLVSDSSRRDARMRTDGLQTDTFPSASFELAAPVAFGLAEVGATVEVEVGGALTLHGVTRPVAVPLQARWNGGTIDVAGSVRIVMADFQIRAPSIPNVVEVAPEGIMEFQLTFVPS